MPDTIEAGCYWCHGPAQIIITVNGPEQTTQVGACRPDLAAVLLDLADYMAPHHWTYWVTE